MTDIIIRSAKFSAFHHDTEYIYGTSLQELKAITGTQRRCTLHTLTQLSLHICLTLLTHHWKQTKKKEETQKARHDLFFLWSVRDFCLLEYVRFKVEKG